ncbi:MAG: NAD(P)-dependent oxidoreductase [Hyphomonadaceae bacterium]
MSDVTVIGLGPMGAALAQTLLQNGQRVIVWNRTAAKTEPLTRAGAVPAEDLASALTASPVIIISVSNYDVSKAILSTPEARAALRGRLVVQLSTGAPHEARASEAWMHAANALYLDGAIFALPDQIGAADTTIFVSGETEAFGASRQLLGLFAGNVAYLGEAIGMAAALDCAMLSFLNAAIIGLIHGARIYEAEGLDIDAFGAMAASLAPVIGDEAKHLADVIRTGKFGAPQASLATYANSVERILAHARDAGIDAAFPAFASRLFQQATAAGFGGEEVAALIKVLRGESQG